MDVRASVALNARTPLTALAELASDKSWEVREAVAKNPRSDAKILEELSLHWAWRVREAVALNPNTPMTIIEKLADDPDQSVALASRRRMAKTRPQRP